jgi:hypothetical protein
MAAMYEFLRQKTASTDRYFADSHRQFTASGQAVLDETCNGAHRGCAAQVAMDNQPDLAPDGASADVVAFQLWIGFAKEFW